MHAQHLSVHFDRAIAYLSVNVTGHKEDYAFCIMIRHITDIAPVSFAVFLLQTYQRLASSLPQSACIALQFVRCLYPLTASCLLAQCIQWGTPAARADGASLPILQTLPLASATLMNHVMSTHVAMQEKKPAAAVPNGEASIGGEQAAASAAPAPVANGDSSAPEANPYAFLPDPQDNHKVC